MNRLRVVVVALVVLVVGVSTGAAASARSAAVTTRVPASATTYVWAGAPHRNYEGAATLAASRISFRTLLQFHTKVPPGSRITSVVLSMVPAVSGAGAFEVRRTRSFRPTRVTWASRPLVNNAVLGSSSPPRRGQVMTVPLGGARLGGTLSLSVSYTVAGIVARIGNPPGSAPALVITFSPRGTPPTTTTTSRVAPTTTTSRVAPTTTTTTTTTGVPTTTTTTGVPPTTTTTTTRVPPTTTTTTTGAAPTALVVDAIGDAGPDATHWNSPLALRLRQDHPAALLWAGDVRNTGTVKEWHLYDVNYGQLKSITVPTPGNHDWGLVNTGYNSEFSSGAPWADTKTYCNVVTLSNGWGVFSINTYAMASCLPKLTTWLDATPGTKKIVLTHEPRFSGGSGHGSSSAQAPIWNAMIGHAFALVSGHDHDSQVIQRDGLVQVVNGCAGAPYYSVSPVAGQLYHSTSAADCTFDRFTLGTQDVKVQAVHADGTVAYARSFPVAP